MSQLNIEISLAEATDLIRLQPLFEEMYAHFFAANGVTELSPNGFKHWQSGYERARNVSRTVYICYDNNTPVGFIEGQIRIGSPVIGQGKLGHTAHLYVNPDYRRNGLAKKLYQTQQTWFISKKISYETLDVVCGNNIGLAFWSAIGFKSSFINMLKPVDLNSRAGAHKKEE